MFKKIILSLLLPWLCLAQILAQPSPVHFSVQQKQVSPSEVHVIFSARIDDGWHVYSADIPDGGPTPTSLTDEGSVGAAPLGKLIPSGKVITEDDKVFGMKVSFFEKQVTFTQKYKVTAPQYHIKGYLEYGACNDRLCAPPTSVDFDFTGNGPSEKITEEKAETEKVVRADADASNVDNAVPGPLPLTATDSIVLPVAPDSLAVAEGADSLTANTYGWWDTSVDELKAKQDDDVTDHSWIYIFIMGFIGGLLALFTPCVWPIIPMTVSFFLKRSKDNRSQGIRDAFTYGAAIVVIYLLLGVVVTALFGAQTLNSLATNAVFNIFFFVLLVVFALSFFGWFELRLPSSWANKVDSKASSTTGFISIFLMAFTLALVSFSCTAPIVGLLLVEASTSGQWMGPALGMLGFALALALPFTLFALFPAWLKQTPKSGAWMNIIKVSLGFIELAFALKFFSVADLAYGWHLLDREVFLSLWIVIFAMLGMYLVGIYKFQSDMTDGEPKKAMPVLCIMLGMCALAFSVYMIPGLWGAPCKAVSAFAPPMYTQDFNLYDKEVKAQFTDYEQGMTYAAQHHKPVLLDFTGYGCVNCRKMEAAVWTDHQVQQMLTDDYVLISLFVDDKTALPQQSTVLLHDGSKKTLRTVGDKWSFLQQTKFGQLTQPFYVAVDNMGHPITGSYSYDEDTDAFISFLKKGISQYKQYKSQ